MSTLRRVAVALLLALGGWMAASVSRDFSPTFDEGAHLAAGYSYWTRNDYRLQPENGNWPQRWAALPLLLHPPAFPSPGDPSWKKSDVWQTAFEFFYTQGNDSVALLAAGRTMIALLMVALAALVYGWSRSLFGTAGGFVSLTLAVFCPNLLAHGGLVTSDLAAALGFTLALLAWWRLLHRVSPGRVAAAGGALGLLALAKFSCVIFAPIALVLAVARLLHRAPIIVAVGARRWRQQGWRRAAALAGGGLAAAALAVALIWAAYGFRFSIMAPGESGGSQLAVSWDEALMATPRTERMSLADGSPPAAPIQDRPGSLQHAIRWMRDYEALPEAWLYGLASVDLFSRHRLEYFAGEDRIEGWPEFFPTAFLLKTTIATLGLALLALATPLLRPALPRRRLAWRLTPLLAFSAIYWAFAITSHLDIGHRHLLPLYPVMYIMVGYVGWAAARGGRRWLAAAVGLALAGQVAESLLARPHYLAYFNGLAGGPGEAHRLFIDSSLDWGQDLPGLRQWLETNARGERVFLSYFGTGDPVSERIQAVRVGDGDFDRRPRTPLPAMTGGVWCLSATMFHRTYTSVRGAWSPAYEREYQRLAAWLHALNQRPQGSAPAEVDGSQLLPAEVVNRLAELEQLRFGRLCDFLERRHPDAEVGSSILIFHLTEADLALALGAPLTMLDDALKAQKAPYP